VNSCQCEKAELLHKSLENSKCILYTDYYDNNNNIDNGNDNNNKDGDGMDVEEEEEEEILNPYKAYGDMYVLIYKKIQEYMAQNVDIVVGAPFHSRDYLSNLFELIQNTNYDVDIMECMTISAKRDKHHQKVYSKWPRALSQIIENQFWLIKTKNMRKKI